MENTKLICEALVRGEGKEDIFKRLEKRGVADKEAAYAQALLTMANATTIEEEAERNKGLARLNMLFANALNQQDFKTCLAVQKEINVLLSLKKEPDSDTLPDLSGGYDS
jgi:vacuolar-type H+-ATPase subunit C/Vma6